MCHNAPWLSVLDKQMRLQFAPKESKADVMSDVETKYVVFMQLRLVCLARGGKPALTAGCGEKLAKLTFSMCRVACKPCMEKTSF